MGSNGKLVLKTEAEDADEQLDGLRLELRRGVLPLAVLASLRRELYGYTLRQELSRHGLEIEESTLYPLLRRLEAQELLLSEWREENKRNKRFYKLSERGRAMLERLLGEWNELNQALKRVVEEETA